MCGIAGICNGHGGSRAVVDLLEASFLLQHRGQDACGIATCDMSGNVTRHRDIGLATEVFANPRKIQGLYGHIGILHERYGTAGSYSIKETQPLYGQSAGGMFLCHNGNLINGWEIEEYLKKGPYIHPYNTSDSGLLLNVFGVGLEGIVGNAPKEIAAADIFTALKDIYTHCKGSFACLIMLSKGTMIGFRDANGIRPLVYGERSNPDGTIDYMFASESVALEKLSFTNIRDVLPGEAVLVQPVSIRHKTARIFHHQVVPMLSYAPDIFEYVYLARPESIIDGISVHLSRQRMGIALAETIAQQLDQAEADALDVVIPVPETSCVSALSASQKLQIPYSHGIVKNRYILRTFIMPEQTQRRKGVLRKLNAVKSEFHGKDVVLIDDSIVRGTTSKEVVKMAREAGARKVVLASCSPPIRYNHIHGINLADRQHLIAYSRTDAEVCKLLGADHLVYLPLEKLIQSCLEGNENGPVKEFETGIFTGDYVTGGHEEYIEYVKKNSLPKKAASQVNVEVLGTMDTTQSAVERFPISYVASL